MSSTMDKMTSAPMHLKCAEHVQEALADDKAEQQVHAAGHRQACAASLQGIDLQAGSQHLAIKGRWL